MKLMQMLADAALLASSHLVYGQDETQMMTVNVPFAFTAAGVSMPAGRYELSRVQVGPALEAADLRPHGCICEGHRPRDLRKAPASFSCSSSITMRPATRSVRFRRKRRPKLRKSRDPAARRNADPKRNRSPPSPCLPDKASAVMLSEAPHPARNQGWGTSRVIRQSDRSSDSRWIDPDLR